MRHPRRAPPPRRAQLHRRRVGPVFVRRDLHEDEPDAPSELVGEFSASREADATPRSKPPPTPSQAGRVAARRPGRYLNAAAAALEARGEEIARDMSAEMGKPLREARGETARASQILRYAASEAFRPWASTSSSRPPARRSHAPTPARRRRADHPVELPDRDPDLEAGARADLREHGRAQARV